MRDTLRHRGPDDAGMVLLPSVALGHRRLSIIDLSPAGRQPMSNEDRTVWLVYNGEVYNYPELGRELRSRGHRFRSDTDSEVLVHLYEEQGERLVHRLRGMFAFAIWDTRRQTLLLARDRFGIKPLYYAGTSDGGLLFGSEIKALLASGLIEPEVEPRGLSEYLANRYTVGEGTLYRGIYRLPPGYTATWRDGTLSLQRYWEPPVSRGCVDPRPDRDLVEEFRARFQESVRLRMIGDAPIGLFLSGGLDSSAIAAAMTEESSRPIRTFSVAFAERAANELPYARAVSRRLGTRHREVVVSATAYFEALPKLIWQEDEPIAFASSVPLYFVSKLAAEDVKVVLTGEGSDELLAGYGRYWRTLYNLRLGTRYQALPAVWRARIGNLIRWLPASRIGARLERTFLARPNTIEDLYLENFTVFDRGRQRQLLTPEFQQLAAAPGGGLDPFVGHRQILAGLDGVSLLERILILDWQTYLQELLMKQDQMSMAASVESRVPFLDQELAEFVARLPNRLRLWGFATKRVLRLAMRGRVPDVVVRRSKMGFPTPLGAWLRDPRFGMMDDLLLSREARQRGVFEYRYVDRLVREHRRGLADHTERLWALLNVELWFRTALQGFREPALTS